MLSRSLRRCLINYGPNLPPTYLLPWSAGLRVSGAIRGGEGCRERDTRITRRSLNTEAAANANTTIGIENTLPKLPAPSATSLSEESASTSVRDLLPLLSAQGHHYITIHIHGFPYVVTQGDTLRLPFRMHEVQPGDVLRLNCASLLGSRDYTLKASAAMSPFTSRPDATTQILDDTSGLLASHSSVPVQSLMPEVPHYIPHIAKNKISYIDPRLYICRATVMGVESEPLRIKEKTKRRQRRVKKVKSKHRYTILRIKELRVRTWEEIDAEESV